MTDDSEGINRTAALLERLLLVEDDQTAVAEIKQMLEPRGIKITVARDGGQAQSVIRMSPLDLVLMQVILPSESGFEICEKVKQNTDRLPIVMLTEVDLDSARNLAQRVGADGYVARPCDADQLIKVMKQAADAVLDRIRNADKIDETGTIKFHCRCGRKHSAKFENRGKYITCSECHDRVQVPNQNMNPFFTYSGKPEDSIDGTLEPLKFITVKCQHCATFYRLVTAGTDGRTCPRCGTVQVGSMSIVGAKMSRAALESSLRVLRVLNGKSKGKKILLPEHLVTFGKAPGCTIRHNSKTISDRHCSLLPTCRGIVVTDLGSQFGTFIDGEQIPPNEEFLLRPNSVLWIGELQFRLIGEDTTLEDAQNRVQSWSAKQEKNQEHGKRVIEAGKDTATEAAQVIQQFWNIGRTKRAAELDA